MVLAIIAIGTAMAAPSLNTLVNDRRAEVGASQLVSAVRLARAEAVKRASMVVIRPVWSGTSLAHWVVRTEADRNPSTRESGDVDLRQFALPASTRVLGIQSSDAPGPALLAFDVFGRNVAVSPGGSPETRQLTLCNGASGLSLSISAMGSAAVQSGGALGC